MRKGLFCSHPFRLRLNWSFHVIFGSSAVHRLEEETVKKKITSNNITANWLLVFVRPSSFSLCWKCRVVEVGATQGERWWWVSSGGGGVCEHWAFMWISANEPTSYHGCWLHTLQPLPSICISYLPPLYFLFLFWAIHDDVWDVWTRPDYRSRKVIVYVLTPLVQRHCSPVSGSTLFLASPERHMFVYTCGRWCRNKVVPPIGKQGGRKGALVTNH